MSPTLVKQCFVFATFLPLVSMATIAVALAIAQKLPEHYVHRITALTFVAATCCMAVVDAWLVLGGEPMTLHLGTAFSLRSYHFDLDFIIDGLSATYLSLNFLLCGLIGAFSARYLHREEGFFRFFIQLDLLAFGVSLIGGGDGLDLVFAGWEIVGLMSALLIAFFVDRKSPVENGLLTYAYYRASDVGLLFAVVILHHSVADGHISKLSVEGLSPGLTVMIGAALIVGAMAKGAIFPFTSWLPRAMEGPTSSSAIFYGALSIHASPFLLLRVAPIFMDSPLLRAMIFILGLLTVVFSLTVGRVQADVKRAFGYAASGQVGLIWIEIAIGWHSLALVHIVGHSILRSWQLIRAPSVLSDRRRIRRGGGGAVGASRPLWLRLIPESQQVRFYCWSLEQWFVEDFLAEVLLPAIFRPFDLLNEWDLAWSRKLDRSAGGDES